MHPHIKSAAVIAVCILAAVSFGGIAQLINMLIGG